MNFFQHLKQVFLHPQKEADNDEKTAEMTRARILDQFVLLVKNPKINNIYYNNCHFNIKIPKNLKLSLLESKKFNQNQY